MGSFTKEKLDIGIKKKKLEVKFNNCVYCSLGKKYNII